MKKIVVNLVILKKSADSADSDETDDSVYAGDSGDPGEYGKYCQGRCQKLKVFFQDFVLNCGWVWVKSPKLFSENTHSVICTANI